MPAPCQLLHWVLKMRVAVLVLKEVTGEWETDTQGKEHAENCVFTVALPTCFWCIEDGTTTLFYKKHYCILSCSHEDIPLIKYEKITKAGKCSSAVEPLPSILNALGPIPSTRKGNKLNKNIVSMC